MGDENPKEDKSMDNDSHGMIRFKDGRKIGKRWQIVKKLDEGGFGRVYKVLDLENENRYAALKVEATDMEGGSAIKLEANVLGQINPKGGMPHFPYYFFARKHIKYVYMVMDLLGRNLKGIKNMYPNDQVPERDWSRWGIQSLHALKLMHDCGFVHRDIKPTNIVFGHGDNTAKYRILHILDFGLARSYALRSRGQWEARRARKRIDFRGTYRYASPNMHRDEDLGRRDDIYSLLFMFIELHSGLPWQEDKNKDDISSKKLYFEEHPGELAKFLPAELDGNFQALRLLTFYSRPNYRTVYEGLLAIMKRCRVKMTDRYDFETEAEHAAWVKGGAKRCQCEEQLKLMDHDPIRIHGPPPLTADNADEPGPTREDLKFAPSPRSSKYQEQSRSGNKSKKSKKSIKQKKR